MKKLKFLVVGGGVGGFWILYHLKKKFPNSELTLHEASDQLFVQSASWVAGGLLSPFLELETMPWDLFPLALSSQKLWKDFYEASKKSFFYEEYGTLAISHKENYGELEGLRMKIDKALQKIQFSPSPYQVVVPSSLEPILGSRFEKGLFFEKEAQLDPREGLRSLETFIKPYATIILNKNTQPNKEKNNFDWIFDTRGIRAKEDIVGLRGVLGDILVLRHTGISLRRPIRLMHPRQPIYVIPRRDGYFICGSTQLETDIQSPITVQSILELLSVCYSLNPDFGDAGLIETRQHLRPAFDDGRPNIIQDNNIIVLNGLYRHGFLLAPAFAKMAVDCIDT